MVETFEIPEGTLPGSVTPSPDASRAAYIVRERQGMHLEVSGQAHPRHDAVSGLTFGADSRVVAYAAARGGRWYAVFGDRELGPYADIGKTSPVISPDSSRVAFTASMGRDGWVAVLDGGVVGGPYEGFAPGGLLFSPDSRRLAYVVKTGKTWTVMDGGREVASHAGVLERSLVFSPDSKKLAYLACEEEKRFLRQPRTVAMLIVDRERGPAWSHDEASGRNGLLDEIVFSHDSSRLAYAVARNGRWAWVVGGEVQAGCDGFVSGWGANPTWASFPDYGKTCCRKQTLVFSPDSRHFAYAGTDGGRHAAFLYGEPQGWHQGILNWPLVFSPDSATLAYGAEEGGRQFMIVNGKAGVRHYGICGDRAFSPDSTQLGYISMEDRDSFSLVVGRRTWQMPGGPLAGCRLVWDGPGHVHTLVAKGRRITIVEWRTC